MAPARPAQIPPSCSGLLDSGTARQAKVNLHAVLAEKNIGGFFPPNAASVCAPSDAAFSFLYDSIAEENSEVRSSDGLRKMTPQQPVGVLRRFSFAQRWAWGLHSLVVANPATFYPVAVVAFILCST